MPSFDPARAMKAKAYRQQRASLPPEEKVRLVVEMQKIRREFAIQTGQRPCLVWKIPELSP
jgi:hypothetical protein